MNYKQIARMAKQGIKFFSDGDGEFTCITGGGGVQIIGGVEVPAKTRRKKIKGLVRNPKAREIDGEMIRATDKLGVFDNSVELKEGYKVVVDGETYTITDPRPIRQTSTTVAYRPILRRISVHG